MSAIVSANVKRLLCLFIVCLLKASKRQLEAELQLSGCGYRSGDLACSGDVGACCGIEDLSAGGNREVCVVKKVENVRLELETFGFSTLKINISREAHVGLKEARPGQNVAAYIAEHSGRRQHKGRRIEILVRVAGDDVLCRT